MDGIFVGPLKPQEMVFFCEYGMNDWITLCWGTYYQMKLAKGKAPFIILNTAVEGTAISTV
jgi:hypothetical protein